MAKKKKVVIRIKNLSKTFRLYKSTTDILLSAFWPKNHKKIEALKNINLEIRKGEVVGFIGYNGSGKTTLLKIIAGIVVPDEGSEVEVNGTLGTMIALGSGFNDELNGIENIYHRAELLGIDKEVIDRKLPKIIKFSRLYDRIEDPIKTYSSGMKARLGFAFYAHINPRIMIVDEITAVGDIKFKRRARRTIRRMFRSKKTILFVSHNLSEIENYCTRAIVLINGEIKDDGDPAELVRKYEEGYYLPDNEDPDNFDEDSEYLQDDDPDYDDPDDDDEDDEENTDSEE